MKLLIDTVICLDYAYRSDSENFEEDSQEEFHYVVESCKEILEDFSVQHSFVNNYTSCSLILNVQKIVLDEIDMNTLFYEVLSQFDTDFKITYSTLGGEGCDFSMRLSV